MTLVVDTIRTTPVYAHQVRNHTFGVWTTQVIFRNRNRSDAADLVNGASSASISNNGLRGGDSGLTLGPSWAVLARAIISLSRRFTATLVSAR